MEKAGKTTTDGKATAAGKATTAGKAATAAKRDKDKTGKADKLDKMAHLDKEKQKLVARIRRIRGQVESVERSLTGGDDCAEILMLLATVRGGINSLMAEVLEDHIRLHLLAPEKSVANAQELAEDMIELVRAYLK